MKHALVATAVLLAASSFPASAQFDAGNVIRCESDDGRSRECAVGYARDARLLRQLSRSACIEGETWGVTPRSIWVTRGCRGEFLIDDRSHDRGPDYGYPGGDEYIRCESDDGRWNRCDTRVPGRVELVRQLSRSDCVRGQSWGSDPRGIWVNGGCRAEFRVEPRGHGRVPERFTCESSNGAPRFCHAGGRGDVRLVRQLSRAPCEEGRTWGRERDGVWVEQGCRAEFEVGGRGRRHD